MSGQSATIIEELAGYLQRPVPEATLERARWHLLDWIGCAVAGRKEPAGRILLSRFGAGQLFAWGGLGNILEMDDVDKRALLHPGPTIIPAALNGSCRASLGELLGAIVRGYEATIRLGRAVGPAHYALWHNTGTCGPIGAAAALASLHELDAEDTAHALALAVSQATGFWQTRHEPASMGKQLHTAHATRAGHDAALLAKEGFRGPLSVLEGRQGFFAATCGADAKPEGVMADYGADWLIHQVSFKPWAACRHAHAAIDAALEHGRRPDAREVVVETYADALTFCDKPDPNTTIEAKFSLQHSVAISLLRGKPTLDDFTPDAINDPAMAAMRARVRVHEADAFTQRFPAHFGAAVMVDGVRIEAMDALGDPENPVSDAQLRAKAVDLIAAGGWSRDEALFEVERLMRVPLNQSAELVSGIVTLLLDVDRDNVR